MHTDQSKVDAGINGSSDSGSVSNPSNSPPTVDWPHSMNDGAYFDSLLQVGAMTDHALPQQVSTQDTPAGDSIQQWNLSFSGPSDTIRELAPSISHATVMPQNSTPDTAVMLHNGSSMPLLADHTSEAAKVLDILRQYPIMFESDDYQTPFLHRELYGFQALGITALPKSTTSISCALGLRNSANASFLKSAMSAERQRLIEGFPNYECLEEWDALHAMWLYEMMELPDPHIIKTDGWKAGPKMQGMNLPMLLKMTRRFCQSHPEANDLSAPMSVDSVNRYLAPPSTWMTWLVGETARRLIFLAHIVNYFATKNPNTGEMSAYYEPLSDDIIWNMPLPSSSAAWKARSEQEWLKALQMDHAVVILENQMLNPTDLAASVPSLRSLFTKFTKDHIELVFGGNYGLEDSESLRGLVIRCALEQCS
ncbi:hypothetical protein K461DRAFT_295935 [Myriangium duriaei CBS 260.36]|uniref:Transcription factor domain-containing protein n=1 Tax=Myriangium duriaei CBS 260.36 TaxID=1168546 RepID=A0A9P4IVF7_9PEZI|nr:hypothetical protein K461DRAFT_295935 [Myriangium duriaei CBS 260.36]